MVGVGGGVAGGMMSYEKTRTTTQKSCFGKDATILLRMIHDTHNI